MSFDANVPDSINAPKPASPFELTERERVLLRRYKDLIAGKRAKDPTVATTPETVRFVLDYIERTQRWHDEHNCHVTQQEHIAGSLAVHVPSNATPSTDVTT